MTAHDLLIWCQLLCIDGDLSRAEPKRFRYTLLHSAGQIARSGRQTRLRNAAGWPWAKQFTTALDTLRTLQPASG